MHEPPPHTHQPPVYVCQSIQPKFLTKAERAALALERRQQEAAEQRAAQDEMRRAHAAAQQVKHDGVQQHHECDAARSPPSLPPACTQHLCLSC